MEFCNYYNSPIGKIILTSDGEFLTGLLFESSKDMKKCDEQLVNKDLKIFDETKRWLDIYFSGKNPSFMPKYKLKNLTPFRKMVADILITIPYGQVVTYNDIAKQIAQKKGIKKMSAQAVGGAVGANSVCLIVPCHRVIGVNGNLIGYGGGLDKKIALLELEHIKIANTHLSKTKEK